MFDLVMLMLVVSSTNFQVPCSLRSISFKVHSCNLTLVKKVN